LVPVGRLLFGRKEGLSGVAREQRPETRGMNGKRL